MRLNDPSDFQAAYVAAVDQSDDENAVSSTKVCSLNEATAKDQDRLKVEAGVKNTGRKSANSVYAYSLAWHPNEAKLLSKPEMLRAAEESIRKHPAWAADAAFGIGGMRQAASATV